MNSRRARAIAALRLHSVVSPTLATGKDAGTQEPRNKVGRPKGLPYISSSCLAHRRGGDRSGKVKFNSSLKNIWPASVYCYRTKHRSRVVRCMTFHFDRYIVV